MTTFATSAVIGVGNEFRRDDGLGWAVAAMVRDQAVVGSLPSGATVHACDGDPGRLMDLWEYAGLTIVVDACFPTRPRPGRVHRWCPLPDATSHATGGAHSTHSLGLATTMRLAQALGRCPRRLVVYAVEGADRSLGTGLTPEVAEALGPLAQRIANDLTQYADATAYEPAPEATTAGVHLCERRPIRGPAQDTPGRSPT